MQNSTVDKPAVAPIGWPSQWHPKGQVSCARPLALRRDTDAALAACRSDRPSCRSRPKKPRLAGPFVTERKNFLKKSIFSTIAGRGGNFVRFA